MEKKLAVLDPNWLEFKPSLMNDGITPVYINRDQVELIKIVEDGIALVRFVSGREERIRVTGP